MKTEGFWFLNITQFLGVLNDNLFKLLLVFMLIALQGAQQSQIILSLAGILFVVPFLLLSIPAGNLADRISKKKITLFIKAIELVAALFGSVAFYLESAFGVYTALFLLAISGAIFGPTKYGMVPELVPLEKLSSSNGLLASFTFLAIIIGTSSAGLIAEWMHNNFFYASFFCLGLALLGLFTATLLPQTPSAGSKKSLHALFFLEIYYTLREASKTKYLLIAIFGSAYFLFIGGFVQLAIIPYALHCLGLTDVQGSYLFLITAFGIAFGSLVAGKLSKKSVKLGLSPIGAFGMALSSFLLGTCTSHLSYVMASLFSIGFFGGIYLIPLDSFIQAASPANERGQNVAANNFMGFVGVLLASFLLYFVGNVLGQPIQTGFIFVGVSTLAIALLFAALLKGPLRSLKP